MIGAVGDIKFQTKEFSLDKNDELLLYSDGLIDFPLKNDTNFSETDLLDELNMNQNLSLEEILKRIIANSEKYQNYNIADDITLLGLRYI
jgi:serine phosphatase RsbU (regulator of sigma subunit)